MSRLIMQQALEALENPFRSAELKKTLNAAAALRQAIEQAEKQEPVALNKNMTLECPAYLHELAKPEPKLTDAGADTNITRGLEPKGSGMVTMNQVGMRVDLKDAPPRKPWVSLTDEERRLIRSDFHGSLDTNAYSRAIEAKLKEKNT